MTLKVDIRVPVGLPVQETADFIASCEAAGFSGVGVHDHQHSGRDVFLTLALAEYLAALVERDLPFYDPSISEDVVAGLNQFALDTGILSKQVPYDQVVATQFSGLWGG